MRPDQAPAQEQVATTSEPVEVAMPAVRTLARIADRTLQGTLQLACSLHFKIAAGVILTIVVLSGIYFAWDYRFLRRHLLEELEQSSHALSTMVLRGLVRVAMLGDHPQLLQQAIEQVRDDASARRILLSDRSGVVRFSADRDLLGRRYDLFDDGCVECHSAGAPKVHSAFVRVEGQEVLRTVTAVPNTRDCRRCHVANADTIGFLVVDFTTDSMRRTLALRRNEMVVRAGTTVLAILIVLGILMNRLVITRITRLTAAAGVLARRCEDPGLQAAEGTDEIGRLGAAFNQMLDSLEVYRQNVRKKERERGLLLDKIVRIQEEERRRISRELHDHVGQSLSALLLAVEPGKACSATCTPPNAGLTCAIGKLLDEVHQMAWQMRPSILDDYGLDCALARYIEDVSSRHAVGIDYQCSVSPGLGRLPSWLEVTLYRVAQEAVTNVVRHAGASRASVVLLRKKQDIILLVEDNGCGFDLRAPRNGNTRLGILGMKERVALCGGQCTIESASGAGTTLTIRIPLKEQEM